jgi:multidrug efflux system membrane fusion protein
MRTRFNIQFTLALLLAIGLPSCTQQEVQATKAPAASPVTVAKVEIQTVPVEVIAIGAVEAYSTVDIKTMVSGELKKVHFTEGQDVKAGNLLFTVDPRPFQTALEQAEANLARDQAALRQAQANLERDKAQAEFGRAQAKRYATMVDEGVISPEQADQILANSKALDEAVKADEAAIGTALASIRSDEASIRSAKVQLSFCYINSPIDGRTGSLQIHEGAIVKANDTSLLNINQLNPIYVSFAVPEGQLSEVKRRMAAGPLRVELRNINDGKPAPTGTLSFIDNVVDQNTGTIRLKATFENSERRLWPGQFVETALRVASEQDVNVAPTRAIQTGQNGQYVFVVRDNQTVDMRTIKPGRVIGDKTVIVEGLQAGDTVVTDGQLQLVPGANVVIKTESPAPGRETS